MSDKSKLAFSYTLHRHGSDTLLAVADAKKVLEFAKSATIVNAIGEKSVAMLLRNGLVKKEDVVNACGLPHVQMFSV